MCTVLALDVYVLHDLATYNGASRNIKAIYSYTLSGFHLRGGGRNAGEASTAQKGLVYTFLYTGVCNIVYSLVDELI